MTGFGALDRERKNYEGRKAGGTSGVHWKGLILLHLAGKAD